MSVGKLLAPECVSSYFGWLETQHTLRNWKTEHSYSKCASIHHVHTAETVYAHPSCT